MLDMEWTNRDAAAQVRRRTPIITRCYQLAFGQNTHRKEDGCLAAVICIGQDKPVTFPLYKGGGRAGRVNIWQGIIETNSFSESPTQTQSATLQKEVVP